MGIWYTPPTAIGITCKFEPTIGPINTVVALATRPVLIATTVTCEANVGAVPVNCTAVPGVGTGMVKGVCARTSPNKLAPTFTGYVGHIEFITSN